MPVKTLEQQDEQSFHSIRRNLKADKVRLSNQLRGLLGDGRQLGCSRDASAALGLVPRQHSAGGKQRLGGIRKRGDPYVRSLVIHGARAVVSRADGKTDPLSCWIQQICP